MTLVLLSFTDRGEALAAQLAQKLGGTAFRSGAPLGLRAWTEKWFPQAEGLIYVGAVGIAVRAVAPYVRHKAADPAVVVVDELGRYAVPILSGHLGGANELARRAAKAVGAQAVITTATDLNGCFAVDEWARHQGWTVAEPERIRLVSARLLAGESVAVTSDFPIAGDCPPGVCLEPEGQVRVTLRQDGSQALHLVPRLATLGVGCKRDTPQQTIEAVFQNFLEDCGLYFQGVAQVCSISLKAEEPGLLAFCRAHGWPFRTFTPQELEAVPGCFTPSAFVKQVTGVDNVCERAAAAGSGGKILVPKYAKEGVTFALAVKETEFNWNWRSEDG
ncbi:MAG: cobalamin biosynthesis protein [Oscillospiraceae bacterium]|nr:cobalamin biosynthesis protein [Oscillospiraceae bacterium]